MGDDRAIRYEENGNVYYRASGLMLCDRIFVALMNEFTPKAHPAWFQEVLDEGTRSESKIIEMYEEKYDCQIIGQQEKVEIEVLDGVFIRGSIDGMVNMALDEPLFEAKKFRESTWNKFLRSGVECMPWYPWQVSAYMHGLGVDECEFTGGLYKDGEIVDIYTHHLQTPPIPLIALKKRVAKLESLFNGGKQVDDTKCNVQVYPCPFFYLHDDDDMHEPAQRLDDEPAQLLLDELAGIKSELTPLNKSVKELEDRKREINSALYGFLQLNGVDDDVEVQIGEVLLKHHTIFNPGSGPYDYVRVTTKKVPTSKAPRSKAVK